MHDREVCKGRSRASRRRRNRRNREDGRARDAAQSPHGRPRRRRTPRQRTSRTKTCAPIRRRRRSLPRCSRCIFPRPIPQKMKIGGIGDPARPHRGGQAQGREAHQAVVEYPRRAEKLEAELAEARAEATRESGRAQNAETLAEERKREVDALEAKLLDAFARIKKDRAKIGGSSRRPREGAAERRGTISKKGDEARAGAPRPTTPGEMVSPGPRGQRPARRRRPEGGPRLRTTFERTQPAPRSRRSPPRCSPRSRAPSSARPRRGRGPPRRRPRRPARRRVRRDGAPSDGEGRSARTRGEKFEASGSIPPRLPPETPIVPGLSPRPRAICDGSRGCTAPATPSSANNVRNRARRTDDRAAADDVYPRAAGRRRRGFFERLPNDLGRRGGRFGPRAVSRTTPRAVRVPAERSRARAHARAPG